MLNGKRKKGIREREVKKLMYEKLGFLWENFGLNILGFTLNKWTDIIKPMSIRSKGSN